MILFFAILVPFEIVSMLAYLTGRPELGPFILWVGLVLAFIGAQLQMLLDTRRE